MPGAHGPMLGLLGHGAMGLEGYYGETDDDTSTRWRARGWPRVRRGSESATVDGLVIRGEAGHGGLR
jgi:hypothetical protein